MLPFAVTILLGAFLQFLVQPLTRTSSFSRRSRLLARGTRDPANGRG
jgi:hypothetical protein